VRKLKTAFAPKQASSWQSEISKLRKPSPADKLGYLYESMSDLRHKYELMDNHSLVDEEGTFSPIARSTGNGSRRSGSLGAARRQAAKLHRSKDAEELDDRLRRTSMDDDFNHAPDSLL